MQTPESFEENGNWVSSTYWITLALDVFYWFINMLPVLHSQYFKFPSTSYGSKPSKDN